MKTVVFNRGRNLEENRAFVEIDKALPTPGPRDLLVRVEAVSINPVDTKVRSGLVPVPEGVDTLGWDAAGTIVAHGSDTTLFSAGDDVFYAGTFTRSGSNAEYQLVDERLAGPKPKSISFAQAAALPLTALTAWELLFDRLQAKSGTAREPRSLLVVGGAGGVGSILLQLARQMTDFTVIATASRPESREWCLLMGAHHVIDHRLPLEDQIANLHIPPVTHVTSLVDTRPYMKSLANIVAPFGKVGVIDDHDQLDAAPLKAKSASLHWEMVFTRQLYRADNVDEQHQILREVARLVDEGILRSTMTRQFSPLSPKVFTTAHILMAKGANIGKIVVSRSPATNVNT